MLFHIDADSDRPVYRQLSDLIVRNVRRGVLTPGSRMPGTRGLARELGVNRNTVVAGYADATDQGYLVGRAGSGVYVRSELPVVPAYAPEAETPPAHRRAAFTFAKPPASNHAPASPTLLRLTEGAPDVRLADLRPLYATARKLLESPSGKTLLRYGDGRGDVRLRETLAGYLGRTRGIVGSAERLVITRGSQHAFELACRVLFAGVAPGVLATAELSYGPLLEVARASGAELIALPLDARGIDVDALARHPRLAEVRAVYVTPHHQYPTAVSLAPERRLALLELARRGGFAILEDDYDYDFYYERPPRLPLAALDDAGGQVLYVGSFTKMLAPNLRVGFLHGPPDFLDAVLRLRLLSDRQGDLLLERALAHFIRDGALERHLNRVRPVYQARRDRLVELLRQHFGDTIDFDVPAGGMAVWLRFRGAVDFGRIRGACEARGVWLADSPEGWRERRGLRLGFASLDERELERAVSVLWEVA